MPGRAQLALRTIAVVLIDAVALMLLSAILPGFDVDGIASAVLAAALIGIANSVVWPLLLRFALPFTVLTLGLGVLVVNGAVVLGVAAIDSGVHVRGLGTGIVVTLGLTLATTVASALLALDDDSWWLRNVVRRRARRTSMAVETDVPGVLFLEIDGLAHEVLERALAEGNAPTLKAWIEDGSHRLERWETDWSSQTGACQAGILHGDNSDMPAFRWWEKDRGGALVTNHVHDAAEIERRHSDGKGLLHADGASRANILSGDAAHSMLTMSTVLDRDRPGGLGQDYFAYFANSYAVARTLLHSVGEVFSERRAAGRQRRADELPRIDRGWTYAFMRAFATVIQLDLQVATVTGDLLAGRPVIYTTFLAYDEVAHHSGLERPDSLAVLRRVDKACARMVAAVEHAPRPYRVVVLSDHGQSQGATFLQRYGETLEAFVERSSGDPVVASIGGGEEARGSMTAGLGELSGSPGLAGRAARSAHGRREQAEKELDPGSEEIPEVVVMASGNLGLISFPRKPGRVTLEQTERDRPGLIDALRTHPGVGFLLVRSESDGAVALGGEGRHRLSDGHVDGVDPLAAFGEGAAGHVARTDGFSNCPDIVLNSTWWPESREVAAFEELVGSHGGMGGSQSYPFVLFPSELSYPAEGVTGAPALHRVFRGWLAQLGHEQYR